MAGLPFLSLVCPDFHFHRKSKYSCVRKNKKYTSWNKEETQTHPAIGMYLRGDITYLINDMYVCRPLSPSLKSADLGTGTVALRHRGLWGTRPKLADSSRPLTPVWPHHAPHGAPRKSPGAHGTKRRAQGWRLPPGSGPPPGASARAATPGPAGRRTAPCRWRPSLRGSYV